MTTHKMGAAATRPPQSERKDYNMKVYICALAKTLFIDMLAFIHIVTKYLIHLIYVV